MTIIDGASPRGVDQLFTLGYPVAAAGGTYTDAGVGSVELEGTFTFTVHGFPITLVNPLVKLDGLTGTLAASGSATDRGGATAPFDRSKTQFTLDLSNATVTLRANGARTINGIVPVSTGRHRARGLPGELAPLRHDEPDARPAVLADPGRRGRAVTGPTARTASTAPTAPTGATPSLRDHPPGQGAVRDQAPRSTCG